MNGQGDMPGQRAGEVEDKAADWLWRQSGDWKIEDQSAFESWLAVSAHHRAAYWRLKAAWGRTERLAALRPSDFRRGTVVKSRAWPIMKFAAVACMAVVGVVAAFYLWPSSEVSYATAVGDQAKITLADGSLVQLNTDTAITVSMDARHRTVTLKKGEAFFDVRHNASRPFSVLAAGHRIVDLGTEFSVRTNGKRLQVTLLRGRARLESESDWVQHHATDLSPGEVVVATANSLSVTNVPAHRLVDALAWRQGKLVFSHVTLAEAAAQFNRYNQTKLVVDPAIADHKISGTFEAGNVQTFASMAQYALGFRAEKKRSEIIISKPTP